MGKWEKIKEGHIGDGKKLMDVEVIGCELKGEWGNGGGDKRSVEEGKELTGSKEERKETKKRGKGVIREVGHLSLFAW